MTKDIYEDEVDRLEGVTFKAMYRAWRMGVEHSPLFDFLTPSRDEENRADGKFCGCPMLVMGGHVAWTDELTRAVRRNREILDCFPLILSTRRQLEAFAAVQRLADKMIPSRRPPRARKNAPQP